MLSCATLATSRLGKRIFKRNFHAGSKFARSRVADDKFMSQGHNRSVWQDTTTFEKYPMLQGHKEYDVAIVGAGITGLTAAVTLKRAGKRVAILERHRVGAGTTGVTTAHITNVIDSSYTDLIKSFGLQTAKEVSESMSFGMHKIEDEVNRLRIDCNFARTNGYYYTEDEKDIKDVVEECEAAKKVGLNVEFLPKGAPLPFKTVAAFQAKGQAQFHALKYLKGLAEYFQGDGCDIFENSPVVNWYDHSDGNSASVTSHSGTVRCRDILGATHYGFASTVLQAETFPIRSYVIAIKPKEKAQEIPNELFWDTAEPYHYLRTYKGTEGTLILIGGADHKCGHGQDNNMAFDALDRYIDKRFPGSERKYKWSGQFYDSTDGMPYIGLAPLSKHIYLATGFMGEGMVFGSLAGTMLAEMAQGIPNKFANLYKPSRVSPSTRLVKEGADVAKRFIVDRIPVSQDVDSVKPGEAKVVQVGLSKAVCYRDENGKAHVHSAVCTHQKCIVQWNDAEKTWDCPCHGSRFDIHGEVIEGPATRNLEPVNLP